MPSTIMHATIFAKYWDSVALCYYVTRGTYPSIDYPGDLRFSRIPEEVRRTEDA